MNSKEWRPQDWKLPCVRGDHPNCYENQTFEAGASAMLKAMIDRLSQLVTNCPQTGCPKWQTCAESCWVFQQINVKCLEQLKGE